MFKKCSGLIGERSARADEANSNIIVWRVLSRHEIMFNVYTRD